ncbi:hypothetical protein HYY70_06930 [Candidatus Woesearchaeota archaeon]|nr:hypothetical protein [Candidatus Woesearchaeota archaeon]
MNPIKKIKAVLQFSNVDILEAGQAFDIFAQTVKGTDEEKGLIKVEFLKEFDEGWAWVKTYSKKKNWSGYPANRGTIYVDPYQMAESLKTNLSKGNHRVACGLFGLGLGWFVGLLRFSPGFIFTVDWVYKYIECVDNLKKKPQFYGMVKKIILSDWTKAVEKRKCSIGGKQVSCKETAEYNRFLESI